MNNIICKTQIISIGVLAKDFIEENMLITFQEGASSDLSDYCYMLAKNFSVNRPLTVNQKIKIGNYSYTVTAVGSIAPKNFIELGHITIIFDGEKQAKLDGSIHVIGEYPVDLNIGDELIISDI